MAGAEERGSEESSEEPSEGSGDDKPLVASEYAQTVVLFPDFPEKSKSLPILLSENPS